MLPVQDDPDALGIGAAETQARPVSTGAHRQLITSIAGVSTNPRKHRHKVSQKVLNWAQQNSRQQRLGSHCLQLLLKLPNLVKNGIRPGRVQIGIDYG
eukprot:scaffold406854_cov33-Prasinocladus_malaysianus.AAC.1